MNENNNYKNGKFLKIVLLVFYELLFLIGFLNAQDSQWINYSTSTVIYSIVEEGNSLWIGTNSGLVKLDKTTGVSTFFNHSNSGLPYNRVNAISIDDSGNKWIGTEGGGFSKFDGSTWTTYNEANTGLPIDFVRTLAIDGNGNKWLGGGDGLIKFDGTKWTNYNVLNSGLPDNWITSIAIDSNGNKWIGTNDKGLAMFDGINWKIYNSKIRAFKVEEYYQYQ